MSYHGESGTGSAECDRANIATQRVEPMRVCSICNALLPWSRFRIYKKTGRPACTCRKCSSKRVVALLSADRERKNRSNRNFKQRNRERIAKQGAEYRKRNRDKINSRYRSRYAQETEKYKARTQLGYAIRTGKIVRPNFCEKCGRKTTPQGHHHDYSKPLEVQWLCQKCHAKVHRKYGRGD